MAQHPRDATPALDSRGATPTLDSEILESQWKKQISETTWVWCFPDHGFVEPDGEELRDAFNPKNAVGLRAWEPSPPVPLSPGETSRLAAHTFHSIGAFQVWKWILRIELFKAGTEERVEHLRYNFHLISQSFTPKKTFTLRSTYGRWKAGGIVLEVADGDEWITWALKSEKFYTSQGYFEEGNELSPANIRKAKKQYGFAIVSSSAAKAQGVKKGLENPTIEKEFVADPDFFVFSVKFYLEPRPRLAS